MAFVFGDTLVCDDAESAKLVTFSPQVGGVRSVTLEGDVYDPSGTLSGGSAPSGSGTLVKVQELLEAERKLESAKRKLVELEKAEAKGKEGRDRWKKLSRELEIKEHEMRLLEEQVEGSNAARVSDISSYPEWFAYEVLQICAEVEALKQTIVDLKAAVQTAKDKHKAA